MATDRKLGFLSGRAGWAAAAVALLFFLALPVQLYGSQQRTLATAFMFIALAQGWNLIGGFAG